MLRDADIREPLFEFLEESYGKIRIFEEKIIGKSRADVVMVIDHALVGIEIKSDADTYQRLKTQVEDYNLFYDMNYVVVGSKHAHHIEEHVPAHWGIITVEELEGKADFYVLKKPQPNEAALLTNQLSLLWKPELSVILEMFNMPKYKDKSREYIAFKIAERTELSNTHKNYIPKENLKAIMAELLFERDYTTIAEELKEYRKGEIQKKLENETDSIKRLELLMEKAEKTKNLKPRAKRRRRRVK